MPSPEAVSGSPFPVHWAGRHAVIMLPAEIDIANARQAEDEIFALLVEQPSALILDMTGTGFCDSSGMAALICAAKRAATLGVPLRLAATGQVTRILHIAGADRFIDSYSTLHAALGNPAPTQPPGPDTGSTTRQPAPAPGSQTAPGGSRGAHPGRRLTPGRSPGLHRLSLPLLHAGQVTGLWVASRHAGNRP